MNLRFKLLLCIIILCAYSCDNKKEVSVTLKNELNISVDNISGFEIGKYSDYYENVEFVKLETNPNILLGRIDKVLFYEDKFFILDQALSKGVFIFDRSGNFIAKVGQNGNGPGEYDEPNDIALNYQTKRVVVYCNNRKKLLIYDFNGKFQKEVYLFNYIRSFTVLDRDKYALYYDKKTQIDPSIDEFYIQIINDKGTVLNNGLKISDNEMLTRSGISFFNNNFPNGVLVTPNYSGSIYEIFLDSIVAKYKIDFGNKTLPETFTNNKENRTKISEYSYIRDFFDLKDYLVISFVHKKIIYNCIYSKKTHAVKHANTFINDKNGLILSSVLAANNDSMLVGHLDPSHTEYFKRIYYTQSTNQEDIKRDIIKNIDRESKSSYLLEIRKMLLNNTLVPTFEEIQELNSIKANDNPVLVLFKIKRF